MDAFVVSDSGRCWVVRLAVSFVSCVGFVLLS